MVTVAKQQMKWAVTNHLQKRHKHHQHHAAAGNFVDHVLLNQNISNTDDA